MTQWKEQQLTEALRRGRPQYEDYRNGTTGVLQSNGSYTDASAGLDSPYSWVVLEGNRAPSRVINMKFARNTAGFQVMTAINTQSGTREILYPLLNTYNLFPPEVVDGVIMPGVPGVVTTTAIDIGRVEPASGLNIYVRRFPHDDTEFPGGNYDLTTIIGGMTASTQEMVLVGVNEATNAITVTQGAEKSLAYTFQMSDVDDITLPEATIPLAGLVIKASQTDSTDSFVPYARWFDRRQFLGVENGDGTFMALTVAHTYTDPSANVSLGSLTATKSLTAASSAGVTALSLTTELNNGTYNDTSSANRAMQLIMNATGTSGTINNLLVAQLLGTISGGVTVTTVRHFRMNDMTVSGGSTLTNNTGLVVLDRSAGTNNVNMYLGPFGSSVPSGNNWSIYNNSAYDNYFAGKVGLGATTPTNDLSFGGNADRTAGLERHSTSNTAGKALTIQSGGATSGATNKAAGALVLVTGINTGNAVPALMKFQAGAVSPTSATTDNSNVDRLVLNASKVLTNNSATTIVNATLAASTMIGGVIRYTIEVWNGTDLQVETGFAVYHGYNKAGAFTCVINEVNSQQSASSGTLATTWAISSANPAAISINANSSLTPSTGYPRITYSIENFSQQAIAIA